MRGRLAWMTSVLVLSGCSLLFDLDRFDEGGARPDAASVSGDGASGGTPPPSADDGGDDGTSPAESGSDSGNGTMPCHAETEPNSSPTQASEVVPGRNCGVVGMGADQIDVWGFDEAGSATLTLFGATNLHYDVSLSGGTPQSYEGAGPFTINASAGSWMITVFPKLPGLGGYTIVLQ